MFIARSLRLCEDRIVKEEVIYDILECKLKYYLFQENEFNKFLAEHGGSSKGRSWCDRTEFCFYITSPHLKEALEM